MPNFDEVFKDKPLCKYVKSYCEYDEPEPVCGQFKHGYLFCFGNCSRYEPKEDNA